MNDKCQVCKGSGKIDVFDSECPFCNGTGEPSKAAETYMKDHICQCIAADRRSCPLCGKRCHHDSNQKPKVLISPM